MGHPTHMNPMDEKDFIDTDPYIGSGFRDDLRDLLNRHSMENGSDTPDYILADYLISCLRTYDAAAQQLKYHLEGPPPKISLETMDGTDSDA